MKLKGFSLLTEEVIDLGLPDVEGNADALLELGGEVATGHDNLVVFAEGNLPTLQEWR